MAGIPGNRRQQLGSIPLLSFVLLAGLTLAGCDDMSNPFAGDDAGAAPDGQSVELVQTDVEAPEVFQVTDTGLWDGRPSLGGVWVAHPDVTEPERVIIRNEANGSFVIGALFRRERDNPGPVIQVSSDAAEALQMLAGAPVTLNVTALRREEPATPATPEATADFGPSPAVTATPLDPIAGAAAALDAVDAEGVTEGAVATMPLDAPVAAETPDAAPAAAPAVAGSDLSRPYIQLGIFSIEANASALATDLGAKGMTTRVIAQETQGKDFWRVLVGPAQTETERDALLEQVKAEGFPDAYFVAN